MEWVRIECIPGQKHVLTLWEYCFEKSNGQRDCYDFSDYGSRRIPGLEEDLTNLVVRKFKQAEGFVMLTMVALLIFGATICLLMNTDQRNCCLLYTAGACVFFAFYASVRTVTLVFGLAGITNPDTWDDGADASCNGSMVTGDGAVLWFCNCILLLLLFFIFLAPLCCGCGLFAICSASGKGGTRCCAQAAEEGEEQAAEATASAGGTFQDFCHKVIIDNICKKGQIVVEAIYVKGKAALIKVVPIVTPLLCLPCYVINKASGGKAVPTLCVRKIAVFFEAIIVVCVVVGIFCGYPGPFPNDEAIGNPWIVATCGPATYPKVVATLFELCDVPNAETVVCYDYDDHAANFFPAHLKKTMYTELQPIALCSLLVVVVVVCTLFVQRFFGAQSSLCSPLGWVLAFAGYAVSIALLTTLSVAIFFASDAMDASKWNYGCVDTVTFSTGAWCFVLAMCFSVLLAFLLLWPVISGVAGCLSCCFLICCPCCKKSTKEEAEEEAEDGKVVV
jgi:hypothetical protein